MDRAPAPAEAATEVGADHDLPEGAAICVLWVAAVAIGSLLLATLMII